LSYTVSNLARFFETQCISHWLIGSMFVCVSALDRRFEFPSNKSAIFVVFSTRFVWLPFPLPFCQHFSICAYLLELNRMQNGILWWSFLSFCTSTCWIGGFVTVSDWLTYLIFEPFCCNERVKPCALPTGNLLVLCHIVTKGKARDMSNKVDTARFRLSSTAICYDFSFDGYLHLRWLRNYGGRVTSKFVFGPNFLKKNGSVENK